MKVWQVVQREEMVRVEAADTGRGLILKTFWELRLSPAGKEESCSSRLSCCTIQSSEQKGRTRSHSLLFSTCSLDTTDTDVNF